MGETCCECCNVDDYEHRNFGLHNHETPCAECRVTTKEEK